MIVQPVVEPMDRFTALVWSLLLLSETIMIHHQTQSGTKSAAGVFFVNQPTPRGECHRYLYLFDFSL